MTCVPLHKSIFLYLSVLSVARVQTTTDSKRILLFQKYIYLFELSALLEHQQISVK